jgi:hypothetical protein
MSLYVAIRNPRAHARRHDRPARVDEGYIGFNSKVAAWITAKISSMWTVGQQVLGRASDLRATQPLEDAEAILHDCEQIQNHLVAQDAYLERCTDLQGEEHDVLAKAADARTVQTYLDAEAVLHACERLQAHLKAQDLAIRHDVEHMEEGRPKRVSEQASRVNLEPGGGRAAGGDA